MLGVEIRIASVLSWLSLRKFWIIQFLIAFKQLTRLDNDNESVDNVSVGLVWMYSKSECRLHNNGNLANRKDVIYEQQGT